MSQERLQKILAAAGVASRRKAEELITAGRVQVNGEVVTELGTKADPHRDTIQLDGKPLKGPERHVYLMLHKPKGYVTTVTDPEGRPTVLDLVRGVQERIFPVGRLDYLSEGLLLLTNDGELMQKLTHASSHVPKTYLVKVSGQPSEEDIDRLRAGILLPPEPTRAGTFGGTQEGMKRRSESVRTQPAQIELSKDQENPWYEVTLTEGRNRQIRRMFEQVGHHVEKIKRVRYGTLELDVEPAQWRPLSPKEVARLRASIGKPFVIEPPRRRREPKREERRELSPDKIRELRDRASTAEDRGERRPPQRERHPERREASGGRTRFERGRTEPRVGRSRGDRERRETPRGDRPQRPAGARPPAERGARPRQDRFDRPRPDRSDRPRGERPQQPKFDRGERPRGDRPQRFERGAGARPSMGRGERPERPRFDRGERPKFERGERPKFDRGERPARPSGRTDRPRGERPERPRFDRGGTGTRGPRTGGGKFGSAPGRRDNKPGKRNR